MNGILSPIKRNVTVVASSTYPGEASCSGLPITKQSPSVVLDDPPKTIWATDNTYPSFLQFTLPKAVHVSSYSFKVTECRRPSCWKLLGTNDPNKWTTSLDTRKSVKYTESQYLITQKYTCTNPGSFRFFRFILDNMGSSESDNYLRIASFELYNDQMPTLKPKNQIFGYVSRNMFSIAIIISSS